jgi:oleandomycin transport system ATP-binding protein
LLDSANLAVGKYSGGMRRRMSVALSTIGEPKIILMDEPTTGMDPVSRRQVWDLI